MRDLFDNHGRVRELPCLASAVAVIATGKAAGWYEVVGMPGRAIAVALVTQQVCVSYATMWLAGGRACFLQGLIGRALGAPGGGLAASQGEGLGEKACKSVDDVDVRRHHTPYPCNQQNAQNSCCQHSASSVCVTLLSA